MRLAYPQLLQASFTWILLGGVGETVVFLTVFSHFLLRLCWLAGWVEVLRKKRETKPPTDSVTKGTVTDVGK